MKLNFKNIIIAIVVLLLLAHLHDINDLWRRLRIGDMVDDTVAYIWSMPQIARYTMVIATAGLLYVTIFILINNRK
jgi:hypothetical protein